MTASTIHLRSRARRRTVRADPLVAALAVAALAGIVALCIALAPAAPRTGAPATPRVAVVIDAGGRPDAALAAAERSRGRAAVAVRVPRSGFEAAADVRYFAAQGYGAVVAVGPVSRTAALAAARAYPRTRFVLRAQVPRVVR